MHKTAVILAGGASRRFGSDKLFAPLHGLPLIEHVVQVLRPLHDEIFIAGPPAKFAYLGLSVIPDRIAFQGPLYALPGIWDHVSSDEILLVAGDMPFLVPEGVAMLWEASKGSDLTWIEGPAGPSPLPGVYGRKSQAAAASLLQRKQFSLKALGGCDLRLKVIAWKAFACCDPSGYSLYNINDKRALRAMAKVQR